MERCKSGEIAGIIKALRILEERRDMYYRLMLVYEGTILQVKIREVEELIELMKVYIENA